MWITLFISNIFMTLKTFQTIKLSTVMLIAMIVSASIIQKNAIIPLTAMIVGSLVLIQLRRMVKGVLADERDYEIAGKAALLSMRIFGWVTAAAMLFFFAERGTNPAFEPIAYTLSYSACLLLLLYAVIAKWYMRPVKTNVRFWISAFLTALIVVVFLVGGMRFFSGEDNWICQNGAWVKHGQPSFPAPQEPCK
jgi:uncharacterized membrane protein